MNRGMRIGHALRAFGPAVLTLLLAWPMAARSEILPFFPEIEIDKATVSHEWPFSVDRGDLTCVEMGSQRFVFFSEKPATDDLVDIVNRRTVVVSTNPLTYFVSFEDRALYLPFKDLETLIKRLAPYETMGLNLCVEAKAKKAN